MTTFHLHGHPRSQDKRWPRERWRRTQRRLRLQKKKDEARKDADALMSALARNHNFVRLLEDQRVDAGNVLALWCLQHNSCSGADCPLAHETPCPVEEAMNILKGMRHAETPVD